MYKLDIPLDLKEKAAIERRRRAEKERQGRIFNARHRQTGVGPSLSFPPLPTSSIDLDRQRSVGPASSRS